MNVPVVFIWHGSVAANDFYSAEVQKAVDASGLGVIPEAKAGSTSNGRTAPATKGALEEELGAAMTAELVAAAYSSINNAVECRPWRGGALDGTAGSSEVTICRRASLGRHRRVIKPWSPYHKMPGLVLWDGPTTCSAVMFQRTADARDRVVNGGHFPRVHPQFGNVQPPLPRIGFGRFKRLAVVSITPTGSRPVSSLQAMGVPAGLPEWCGIGQGSATPRTGECLDPPAC